MKGIKLDFFEERVEVKRPRTRLATKWQKYAEEDTSETPLEQSVQTKKKKLSKVQPFNRHRVMIQR